MLPLGLAVAVAAALISLLLIVPAFENGASEPIQLGGSGGGGEPPAWMMAKLDSLPLYPGAENQDPIQRAVYTGGDEISAGYWVKDPPEQVIAFYVRELPKAGWQPETPPTTQTREKGGETFTGVRATFVKDDLRLTIGVSPNTKDPERGASRLGVGIERR